MVALLGSISPLPLPARVSALTAGAAMRKSSEFEAFFTENYGAVVRTLTMITGDAEMAADAAQEAFQRAYVRWSRIRTYDAPAAWVRRVAINHSRDLIRSEQRRRRHEQRAAPHELVEVPAGRTESTVPDLLATLPERQRVAMALYYLDQLPISQVAVAMDISEGAVKYHLNQGREKLRPVLEKRIDR